MEKKQICSRKTADVCTNSKQWLHNARRRENPSQTSSKTDAQRSNKANTVKNRTNVIKRSRTRDWNASMPLDISTSSAGLTFADLSAPGSQSLREVELNSVSSSGNKKQNLNHLLNFHYVSRESGNSAPKAIGHGSYNRNTTKKHKYNKEQFLQANFQFVVKASAGFQANRVSPDMLVDWALIEQIIIQTTEEPQCPICLYPPVAAKLTRCGHAYCWPCILHYLALSDKTWRKCPICYEAIHSKDLKSTVIVQQQNFIVGDFVTLQLMCRKQGSLLIEKVGNKHNDESILHVNAPMDEKKFSKFLLADLNEILIILERERLELTSADNYDCPESVFIKQALDLLNERRSDIVQELDKNEKDYKIRIIDNIGPKSLSFLEQSIKNVSLVNESSVEMIDESAASGSNTISTTNFNDKEFPGNDTKFYYFYQSGDGQNIYLHALNVKMLQAMYGTLEKSPATIKGKIIQKESHSMDEDLRKRLRYLQHLPLTCQFYVVEVQLEPPVISDQVLQMFRDEIIQRQKLRTRRAREERKRERQINEINERQMGKLMSRSANIDLMSPQQFPTCGFDDVLNANSLSNFPSSNSSDILDSLPSTKNNVLTFAKMLSSPQKEFWPSLDMPAAVGFETSGGTVSGESAASCSVDQLSEGESTYDVNGDPAHYAKQNFGDVITEALHQQQESKNKGKLNGGSNKKTKKTKKMLLFSTGMNFSGN